MADLPFDPKSPRSKTDGSEPPVVADISLDDEDNDPFPLNFVRGLGDDIVDLTDSDDAATPGLLSARPDRKLANEEPTPEPEKPRLGPAPLRPERGRTEWRSAGRMPESDATANAGAEAAAMPEARSAVGGQPLRISPRPDTEQEPVVSSAASDPEPLRADPAAAPATSIAPEPRGSWTAFLLSMLVVSALAVGAWWWSYARAPEVAMVVDGLSRVAAGRTQAVPPDAASPAEPAEVPVVVAGLPAAEWAPSVNTGMVLTERPKPASGQGLVEPLKTNPVQTEPREPTPAVPSQPLRVEAAPQMQTEPPAPLRAPEPTEPMQADNTSLQPSPASAAVALPPPAPVELQRDAPTYRSAGARADQMATYQSGREAPIVLLADPCPTDKTGQSKVAYQKKSKSDMVAGCWSFDLQNHPVVTWLDGRVQALDAAQVRYEPNHAQAVEEKRADAAPQAKAPSQAVTAPQADALPQVAVAPPADARPRVVVAPRTNAPPLAKAPSAAPDSATARPAWCKDAKREHELLICRDPELAANDLALSPYWRAYRSRMGLDRAEETRVKNDFYRRLTACRSTRECISAEQAVQMAFYRRALGRE